MTYRREIITDGDGLRELTYVDMDELRAVADECAERRATGDVGEKDMRALMTVPAVFVEAYCNTHGVGFAEFMRNPDHAARMIRDPALAAFRIHPGGL